MEAVLSLVPQRRSVICASEERRRPLSPRPTFDDEPGGDVSLTVLISVLVSHPYRLTLNGTLEINSTLLGKVSH